ncbi:MAG: carbon storage regulator [Planctomycetaceae bacterium]|nr:carbon storage regulator [Planctomycetaceae bacterium]
MLVLSRKKNEGVVLGGPGRVVVVEIRGDKVRLGFDADPSVPVHRDEVNAAILRNGEGTVDDAIP